MGLIYNKNVQEQKIYEAYGLTVYGKINRYMWTIRDNEEENALITIRIVDNAGNDIFFMNMGNRCIFQSRIDDTLDNFLWWMSEERPEKNTIEETIYRCLCASDSLFNHSILNKKIRQKREKEEQKRAEKLKREEEEAIDRIKIYCSKNGFISHFGYGGVYIIKPYTENTREVLEGAKNNRDNMKNYIQFIQEYPNNKDAIIIKSGSMEKILQYISEQEGKGRNKR